MVTHNSDGTHQDKTRFRSSVITVTPEQARLWLETMKYKHQRTVSRSHVDLLVNEIRHGRFIPATTIRLVYFEDQVHIIDGQHRLNAVVQSGEAQIFTLLEEWAPNEEYIAWAYGSLDIGRRRAPGDLYSALELPERLGLTKTHINHLSPAMEFMAGGMLARKDGVRSDRHQRLAMMEIYAPYMRRYTEIINGCDKSIRGATERSYVIAVAMLTLRFSDPYAISRGAPDVTEFWRGAVFDDKIATNDPRKIANRHLLTTTMTNSHNSIGIRSITTAPYGARHLAACFNAYMARETRKMVKVYDASAPFAMFGVPRSTDDWPI